MELSSKLGVGTICIVPLCEVLIFYHSTCPRGLVSLTRRLWIEISHSQ